MKTTVNTNKKQTFAEKKFNYTPVFKLHLAGWLMTQGFILIYCKHNEHHRDKIVYYFLSSDKLNNAIKEYSNSGHHL